MAEGENHEKNDQIRFDITWKQPSFPVLNNCPNAALLFQRYNPGFFCDFGALKGYPSQDFNRRDRDVGEAEGQWPKAVSLAWFARFCEAGVLDAKLLDGIQKRRSGALAGQRWIELPVQTTGRSAVGLAQAAPYENSGWAFQHTYGFPILPAASLKGLASHFLLEEWGWALNAEGEPIKNGRGKRPLAEIPELGATCKVLSGPGVPLPASGATAQDLADLLFGASGAGEGAIVILDAWPLKGFGWFEVDVLTPHHPQYYDSDSKVKPSDEDEPKPHQFLVVKKGVEFRLHIGLTRWAAGLERKRGEALLGTARAVVLAALASWGIGAKTASGYGQMREPAAREGKA